MQLALALYRTGRQADALRILHDFRRTAARGARASTRHQPWPSWSSGCSRTTSPCCCSEPAGHPLRGYRLGERLGTGPRRHGLSPAACPASSATSRSASSGSRSRTTPSSSGRSRPAPTWWRRCVTPRSSRSMTTGVSRGLPTSSCGACTAEPWPSGWHRGPLAPATATAMVGRIGAALVAAAERGIAHGRVVPESVFFDAAGDAFLGDFQLGTTHPAADQQRRRPRPGRDGSGPACAADGGPVDDVLARGVATRRATEPGGVRADAGRRQWPAQMQPWSARARTRTRASGPSTRPTRRTSSVGPTSSTRS